MIDTLRMSAAEKVKLWQLAKSLKLPEGSIYWWKKGEATLIQPFISHGKTMYPDPMSLLRRLNPANEAKIYPYWQNILAAMRYLTNPYTPFNRTDGPSLDMASALFVNSLAVAKEISGTHLLLPAQIGLCPVKTVPMNISTQCGVLRYNDWTIPVINELNIETIIINGHPVRMTNFSLLTYTGNGKQNVLPISTYRLH